MDTKPRGIGDKIVRMLESGMSYRAISRKLKCSKSSVWYYAKRRGTAKEIVRYDWPGIDAYVQSGHSLADAMEKFGFARSTWEAAVRREAVRSTKQESVLDLPLSAVLCRESRFDQKAVRRYVREKEVISYSCALCDVGAEWMGKPLTLILDHVNGDNGDHRKKNLRFLCPNCNIQTPTYGSKNRGRVPGTRRNTYRRNYERSK